MLVAVEIVVERVVDVEDEVGVVEGIQDDEVVIEDLEVNVE